MKGKIVHKEKEKTFESFSVVIEIENIAEARLLYHICNHENLLSAIRNSGYPKNAIDENCANNLAETKLFEYIRKEIEEQGYQI